MTKTGWNHWRTHLCWLPATLAILFFTGAVPAAEINYGAAIDAAGRQRMLSQRIVKAYCQIGLKVMPEVSRSQLTGAVRRFDAQLVELARITPNAATREAFARLSKSWRPFRGIALGPVGPNGARALATRSEAVLGAAHELVLVLQEAAGTPQARLVNIAGRERMLSQRLAKIYMLRAYGVDSPAIREDMATTSNEFAGALATLRSAPENTPVIQRELDAVALQWEWFKSALALQGAESYVYVVADASESILNSMDLITAKYAELARP